MRDKTRRRPIAGMLVGLLLALINIDPGQAAPETYTYDALGRLKQVDWGNGYKTTYNLDASGNRVTESTTIDTSPPTAPTGLTANGVTYNTIAVFWNPATDDVGVAGYYLERCAGNGCGNFVQIAVTTATGRSDGGLTGGTYYTYRVRAFDAAGNVGPYSAVAVGRTL